MTDQKPYHFPTAAVYGLFLLLRGLWSLLDRPPAERRPGPSVSVRPIVTPPPKPPSPRPPPPLVTPPPRLVAPRAPVAQWTADGELLAWRFWHLCRWRADGKIRLASLTARWAWDGPVFRAHAVPGAHDSGPVGVYALKGRLTGRDSRTWCTAIHVVGSVALSGRVVEHERGYRAQQVAIRNLRLTVGAHLTLRRDELLRQVVRELEQRYQAPVRPAWGDRRFAQGDREGRLVAEPFPICWVSPAEGWQLG